MSGNTLHKNKADGSDALVELITGALENGEFKDLTTGALKRVTYWLKRIERDAETNRDKYDNPPIPAPRKRRPVIEASGFDYAPETTPRKRKGRG